METEEAGISPEDGPASGNGTGVSGTPASVINLAELIQNVKDTTGNFVKPIPGLFACGTDTANVVFGGTSPAPPCSGP